MPKSFPSKSETAIPAGYYDKRIVIQKNIGAKDPVGTIIDDWVDYIKTWAHVSSFVSRGIRGDKTVQAGQVYPTKITSFYIRYRPVIIDTSMRVKYKNRIHDIAVVTIPEEAQTTIEIHSLEHLAKGSS
jgi:SPP1 family predicted phage head-tail adaptor